MQRTKSLSIKIIKAYKYALVGLVSTLFLLYIYTMAERGWVGTVTAAIYIFIMIYYWLPRLKTFLKSIKEVSYDNQNLFVKEGEYEIQIPFYEIKDIEILSLDGLYKFRLYRHDQFGDEVICKPSIWYPLNFRKIDAELNRIRRLVRKAHFEYKPEGLGNNVLPSNSL